MNKRYFGWARWLVIGSMLLLLVLPLGAQDDAAEGSTDADMSEEEEPEIPFYSSSEGFNVPILSTWVDESDNMTALFTNTDLQARIVTAAAGEGDDPTAVASDKLGITIGSEPIFTNRVNTADGTWEQRYYDEGDTHISILSKTQEGRRYVIAFIESNPDVAVYMPLIDRTWDDESALPGIEQSIESLGIATADELPEPTLGTVSLPTGEWQTATYDLDGTIVTGYGLNFGVTDYVAIAVGDNASVPDLVDAYNYTLLGGFFVTTSNVEYLYLGLAVVVIIFAVLLISMWMRWRNARRDLRTVEQLTSL